MLDRPPSLRGPRPDFPTDYGYDLWVVYLVWAAVVLALYPVCRWYAGLKQAEPIANPQLPLRLQFRLQFLNSEF